MLVIKTLSPVSNFQNLQLYLAKIISYKNFSEANFFKISRFEVMTSRFAVNTLCYADRLCGSYRERNYSLNYTQKIVRHNMEVDHTTLKLYTV